MPEWTLRMATAADAAELLEIYAPFITNTEITFEYTVPSAEVFAERIGTILTFYPWLVAEADGRIAGYAYAARDRERAAYQWNAELSIYVRPEYQHRGLAQALYGALLELLYLQGIRNVYGVITHPNPKSERFHEKFGFSSVGVFRHTGYKFGRWLDVLWMEKTLGEIAAIPRPPRSIAEIPAAKVSKVFAAFSRPPIG